MHAFGQIHPEQSFAHGLSCVRRQKQFVIPSKSGAYSMIINPTHTIENKFPAHGNVVHPCFTISIYGELSRKGWRVGWALSTPEMLRGLAVHHANTSYCAPSPLQHGLAVALDKEDGSFEVSRTSFIPEECRDEREQLSGNGLLSLLTKEDDLLSVTLPDRVAAQQKTS